MTSDGNASSTDHGFNYGATTAYGSTASTTGTFGTGAFSKNVTGLTCATTYHYRSFAINSAGTGTTTDSTFTTSACPARPTVSLSSPTSVDTTSVTLNASLDSDGTASSTLRGFYYGLTSSYGSTASTTGTFGISNFSESLTGLTCGITYYYQAFAVNTEGTATSTGSSFTTSSCPVTSTPTVTTSSSGGSSSASSQIRNLIAMGNYELAQQVAARYGLNVAATASNNPVVTSFVRNLSTGTSGGDVKALQVYLNAKGYTVSTTGPGSKGNETNTFGGLTRQALIKFQKANNIFPPIGYFGPVTRAFVTKNP